MYFVVQVLSDGRRNVYIQNNGRRKDSQQSSCSNPCNRSHPQKYHSSTYFISQKIQLLPESNDTKRNVKIIPEKHTKGLIWYSFELYFSQEPSFTIEDEHKLMSIRLLDLVIVNPYCDFFKTIIHRKPMLIHMLGDVLSMGHSSSARDRSIDITNDN